MTKLSDEWQTPQDLFDVVSFNPHFDGVYFVCAPRLIKICGQDVPEGKWLITIKDKKITGIKSYEK